MKGISQFIKEALINESNGSYVRITLLGCEASNKLMEELPAVCDKAGMYFEKIDSNSFKVKVKAGNDVTPLVNKLEDLISNVPEDKKEEAEDSIEHLRADIEKLKETAEENNGE